jgi:alkaline phosphatase D
MWNSFTLLMRFIPLLFIPIGLKSQSVFFTNGFKISEVNDHQATVWTRLCGQQSANPIVHQRETKVFRHPIGFDENMPISKMDGGVNGAEGWVRITLTDGKKKHRSSWMLTSAERDFTAFTQFDQLKANTLYAVLLEAKSTKSKQKVTTKGAFKTAPVTTESKSVSLTTSTCQYFWSYDDSVSGFQTYLSMKQMQPDFFVQTGDYVYYDKPGPMATNGEKARHKWHAMDAWASIKEFYKTTPVYLLKDDHDLLENDVHKTSKPFGELTLGEGLEIWKENVPLRDKPYRTVQWGKDIQFWFLEGREYRSDNEMPDGESKTIWGEEQKAWIVNTIESSTARFKIIFSPTPIVGPDRGTKADNHANKAFKTEGDWARNFLSKNKVIVINGDRHWQYVSRDATTGLWEFGSGPVSDFHAQGWPVGEKRPEHRFLRVAGGFLGLQLLYIDEHPELVITHYDVTGKKVHQEIIKDL